MLRIPVRSTLTLLMATVISCGDGNDQASPRPAVASLSVSPDEVTLDVGASQQLTATAYDEDDNALAGPTFTWTSSESAVAAVTDAGVVYGVGPGSATITATSEGKSGSATIAVAAPVASVTVAPAELTLLREASQQLTATARDSVGNPLPGRLVTWSSAAPDYATVTSTGLVTGVSAGTPMITATSEGKQATVMVTVLSSVTFTAFATGGAHTCALADDGAAFCWGRGENGQLGIPVPFTTCMTDGGAHPCSKLPVVVGGGLVFARLTGGGAHTCGLTSDGSAYCWGTNSRGQLGDNSTASRDAPVPVATELKFVSIDAGAEHTCGITHDDTAYCWGLNNIGQLGDGTTTSISVPRPVTGGHDFRQIVAGGFAPLGGGALGHTCALTATGQGYCWGDNAAGQLGLGVKDLDAHPVPAPVQGDLSFASMTTGLGQHTCGRTEQGAAYCWGDNSAGALGNGSTQQRSAPGPVSGGLAFEQLIAGGFIGHTCGLTGANQAYCWGENLTGQLGDNSLVDRLIPTAVTGNHVFTNLDAGFRHTCGLAAGTLYCWGSNGAGQLGIHSHAVEEPTKVMGQP